MVDLPGRIQMNRENATSLLADVALDCGFHRYRGRLIYSLSDKWNIDFIPSVNMYPREVLFSPFFKLCSNEVLAMCQSIKIEPDGDNCIYQYRLAHINKNFDPVNVLQDQDIARNQMKEEIRSTIVPFSLSRASLSDLLRNDLAMWVGEPRYIRKVALILLTLNRIDECSKYLRQLELDNQLNSESNDPKLRHSRKVFWKSLEVRKELSDFLTS